MSLSHPPYCTETDIMGICPTWFQYSFMVIRETGPVAENQTLQSLQPASLGVHTQDNKVSAFWFPC